MFELFSTLLKGTTDRAAAGLGGTSPLQQRIRAVETRINDIKRDLAPLVHRQRAEQIGLGQLARRRSALEDRVRQALAAGSNDLAANGARAIANVENDEAARRHALARLDSRIASLRNALAQQQRAIDDLRQGPHASGSPDPGRSDALFQRGAEMVEPYDPAEATADIEPAGRVRAEDVLVRLRTTPAPTTQYASP